ncbi:MAG TPA: hypothetical protein VKC89_01655 [Patescibacteria group bacterium]|nr:hypothetical protein [Patescibacteria group bacterium]
MTKKQIKTLALKSFVRNNLDSNKVKLFMKKMKRRQLRVYIKYLKYFEARNKVIIIVPDLKLVSKKELSSFAKLYPNKKIDYREDPSIILGVRLIDNDLIHDFNLNNSLESITAQI